jgi:hypothetical protein
MALVHLQMKKFIMFQSENILKSEQTDNLHRMIKIMFYIFPNHLIIICLTTIFV